MSLNLPTFTEDMNKISSLDDQPALSTSALKAKFDEGGTAIKNYLNNTLIPQVQTQVLQELSSNLATAKSYTDEAVGAISQEASDISYDNSSSSLLATNVQTAIDELKTKTSEASSSASEKIKYSDFAFSSHSTGSLTLTEGQTRTGTLSLSKAGYYPLAIIGHNNTQAEFDIIRSEITSRSNGTGTLSYSFHNRDYGNSRTGTVTFDILWVKVS